MSERKARPAAAAADDPFAEVRGQGGFLTVMAVLGAGGVAALALLSSTASEPFVLTLIALLATAGVFFLFAMLAGHVRLTERVTDADLVQALADNIDEGVEITGRDGRLIYANRAMADLLGRNELGEINTFEVAFAGTAAAGESLFRLTRAANAGEPRTEEFHIDRADGAPARWFRLGVRPLRFAGRESSIGPLAIWHIVETTGDRAREAETVSRLSRRLDDYDALPFGLLGVAADGTVREINGVLGSWLGLSDAQRMRGLKLADLAANDGAAQLRAAARQAQREAVRLDIDLVREDGRVWPATVSLVARGEPGSGAFVAAVQDRGAGASGDRPADMRYQRFFQAAPLGIAMVARDGRVTTANPAFARLLLAAPVGEGAAAVDLLAQGAEPETRSAIETALEQALAGKAAIAPVEITVGDSREFTRRLVMSPLARSARAREAAIVYVIDATEQKALELSFAQSQKMEAVGKLAGGIAHDFNNVLTAIIGFSDLLLQTHRPSDPAHKNIMAIKSSANRAAGMVSQLLAFSRRQTLQPEVLQLGETLTDLSVLLNRLLGEKVDLKIHQGRDLWPVKADRTQLGQVVMNLAVNARDAMPDGGRLSIRTRNISERDSQKLEDQGLPVAEYVLIEVEDSGHGMPPDVMAKIFEPFFTTKGVGKGTGLGLATVYGIVKQTGGYIVPESEVGRGTVFRVYLPRHHADPADEQQVVRAPRKERPQADLTGSGRVLLVEDEDAVRSFAVEALKRQGYEVLQATTGAEALEVLAEKGGRVDIVVSDVIMPEMDGPTLLKELRKSQPQMKFIFMSGYPDDAFKTSLEPGTEFAFLQKPFSLAQLAAKVKGELGR